MSDHIDSTLKMMQEQTIREAHLYAKQFESKQQPATYTTDKYEIASAPTKPTSLTKAFMPLLLLGTGMAGLATHSWWVIIVTSIIGWAAIYQTEKFFKTQTGKKLGQF
jgi:hypothetical protein